MSEPIEVYPFEHQGKEYEVRVFTNDTGYGLYVYKDGKRIEQALPFLDPYEYLPQTASHDESARAEGAANLLIKWFKEHFHRFNLDE